MQTLTKEDLVNAILPLGLTSSQAETIIETILDTMKKTLIKKNRIEIRDFGVFEVKRTKERASNLIAGAVIPARLTVKFKVGKQFAVDLQEAR